MNLPIDLSLDIFNSLYAQIIIAISLGCALWLITFYRATVSRVNRQAANNAEEASVDTSLAIQPLSVIVYCKDSAEQLALMLPSLLAQDFPAAFEIIVATDGRSQRAEHVVQQLSERHRNLHLTYVPDDAYALSRKKLAITLGIKAARYDYVLLTDANIAINSPRWLATMARHFAQGNDIVIGHSIHKGYTDATLPSLAAFNMLADKATYLSSALKGKPYRSSESNLAFKRELFFDCKGFNNSFNYHQGIDDIFLSSIAEMGKCAVEISSDAHIFTQSHKPEETLRINRANHIFTGHRLRHGTRRIMGFSSLVMWVWLATTIAAGLLFYPSLLPLAASLVAGIIWLTTATLTWKRTASTLGIKISTAALPLLIFLRPFSTLAARIRARRHRSHFYTWTKLA